VVRSVLERERNSRGCCVHMTYMHMVVVERKGEEEGKRERERYMHLLWKRAALWVLQSYRYPFLSFSLASFET